MGVVSDKDAQERDGEGVYKGKRLLKVSRKTDKKPAVGSQNAGLPFAPIGRGGIKLLHANGANRWMTLRVYAHTDRETHTHAQS